MILAIDIGNTNIVVGCIDDQKTYFIERLATVRTKTELEYAGAVFVLSVASLSVKDVFCSSIQPTNMLVFAI